jgi:hypothetical protein
MDLVRFYAACLRHTPRAYWWLIGVVSTVATFAAAAVAVFRPFDPEIMNPLLVALMILLLIVCLLVVPWAQAFRMYREARTEAEAERALRQTAEGRVAQELAVLRSPDLQDLDALLNRASAHQAACASVRRDTDPLASPDAIRQWGYDALRLLQEISPQDCVEFTQGNLGLGGQAELLRRVRARIARPPAL